ncbi:hypothetical protein [Amycolatopsis sp. NPDC001319]|uniref:hypothetical protein n=1 Tax=unclassified Amycolatopsis TaxID=2618356 RepID=UPI003681A085
MTEVLPGVRLGVVRGISYGLFGEPGEFVPQARALGAGLLRAYVFWSQVEPRPGEYDWTAVDALLAQLDGDEEVWLTVCSSSPWATKVPTDFLPPSPAHDPATYGRFARELVRRCAGRVHFWQCDNEPSNTGLLWAGTAEEYVGQLKVLHDGVKEVDPAALVVLGGCGYDVFSSEPGSEPRKFFDHLVSAGREHFDVFSVHLYGDPSAVPSYVDTAREMMAAYGEPKPIVAGEHGGPVPFEFPELEPVMQQAFLSAFADAPATQSTGELQERATQETPERAAMRALYARMAELPPRLQMFLDGCPPELDALRDRIGCRQLVVRTVLALASGIRRTAYWNLAPEVPGPVDPLQMMHLLFGKLPLLGYHGRSLAVRRPMADTFSLVAEQLAGAERVSRMDTEVPAYAVERAGRGPLVVVWDQRDPVDGEQEPPVPVTLPWTASEAVAVDAFGAPVSVRLDGGTVRLAVSLTPVFVSGP